MADKTADAQAPNRDLGLYQLVEGRHGLFLANPNDAYIGRSLVTYGEFSELEWALLGQLVRKGSCVVEVGANIGAHTVSLAKQVGPTGRVLAIEPQPILFQNLCANIALNGQMNVVTKNIGCGEKDSKLAFPPIDYSQYGNFGAISLEKLPQAENDLQTIDIRRLDAVFEFDRLNLIKIDVEGMEIGVLKGAAETIKRHRPALYVENDRHEHSGALIQLLWDMEYDLWWHTPHYFNPKNHFGVSENLFPGTVSINMLGLPKEVSSKIDGLKQVTSKDEHPIPRK